MRLRFFDVRSLLTLRALRNLELDFLIFFQRLESVHRNCRKMSEQIFATAIWRDKSETLGIVEPFHYTGCHFALSKLT